MGVDQKAASVDSVAVVISYARASDTFSRLRAHGLGIDRAVGDTVELQHRLGISTSLFSAWHPQPVLGTASCCLLQNAVLLTQWAPFPLSNESTSPYRNRSFNTHMRQRPRVATA